MEVIESEMEVVKTTDSCFALPKVETPKPKSEVKVVKTINSCLVVPEVETPNHKIWLSNLDLYMRKTHVPTIYLYNHNGDPSFFSTDKLKAALSKTLVPFYPFAGCVGFDQDGRMELNCNCEGAVFVEAECSSTMDEFDFSPSEHLRKLLVPMDTSPHCSLLLLQVTFFKCRGVCLGTAVHHAVADGSAAIRFFNAWADISRGIDPATIPPPFLDRTLLATRSPPIIKFPHTEYVGCTKQANAPHSPVPLASILQLSGEQLSKLKNGKKGRLTIFTAVATHAWRCACKAKALAADQPTRLFIQADIRGRVRPPLPLEYLGNAILTIMAEAVVGEVVSSPPEHLGSKFEAAKSKLDDEYIRSLMDFLEVEKAAHHPVPSSTDFVANAWLRMSVYEADFGWGTPVFMVRAVMPNTGWFYIMRGSGDNDGGISIVVAFEPEVMQVFKKVFYDELDASST